MSEDDKTTKPTIETVLERINAFSQQFQTFQENTNVQLTEMREIVVRLEEKQDKMQADLDTVKSELNDLKNELRVGLKRIELKITVLADDVLTVPSLQRDLETRVDKLEPRTT